eukprot:4214954-Karenia_brevis.AAC.1
MVRNLGSEIRFVFNPHRQGTKIHDLYEKVRMSKTIGEAKEKGASQWDLRKWAEGGHVEWKDASG